MSEIYLNNLFFRGYNVNLFYAQEIIIETYRESEYEEGWEAEMINIGVRVFQDGTLQEDILLHQVGNYGLFSLYAVNRHRTQMEFALSIATLIANVISNGFEEHAFKIKKRLVSGSHLYFLTIPENYTVDMPGPDERLSTLLSFERRETELRRKKLSDPSIDISEAMNRIQKENYEFVKDSASKKT